MVNLYFLHLLSKSNKDALQIKPAPTPTNQKSKHTRTLSKGTKITLKPKIGMKKSMKLSDDVDGNS
jgi:hypothetical protein